MDAAEAPLERSGNDGATPGTVRAGRERTETETSKPERRTYAIRENLAYTDRVTRTFVPQSFIARFLTTPALSELAARNADPSEPVVIDLPDGVSATVWNANEPNFILRGDEREMRKKRYGERRPAAEANPLMER